MYDCMRLGYGPVHFHSLFSSLRETLALTFSQNSGLEGCLYMAMYLPTSGNKPPRRCFKGTFWPNSVVTKGKSPLN